MTFSDSFVNIDKSKQLLREFDCGKESMNQYLTRFAEKHTKLGLSKTMVLPLVGVGKQYVAAYYTLSASSIAKEVISPKQSLPRYPIPVAVLARLAVDKHYQGHRLGEKALATALEHAVQLSDNGLPMYGVVLDVLDDDAMGFYKQFDFFSLTTGQNANRLFVPIKTLRKLL